jgi:hypothetical protein
MDTLNFLFFITALACFGVCIWASSIVVRLLQEYRKQLQEVRELKQYIIDNIYKVEKQEAGEVKPVSKLAQLLADGKQ